MIRSRSAALFVGLAAGLAAGEPGAPFLAVSPSARVEALSGLWAFGAGMEHLAVNPALLSVEKSPWQFYSSAGQLGEDVQMAHAAIGRAHGRTPWGLGVTHLRSDGGSARDALGGGGGADVGAQDTALHVAVARSINGRIWLGAAGKGFQSKLASYTSDPAVAADLGLLWRGETLEAGVSWRNIGSGVRFVSQRDPLPQTIDAQIALRRGPAIASVGAQRDVPRGENRVLAGAEFSLGALAFRTGYAVQEGASSNARGVERLTLGFGLALPNRLKLDYSLRQGTEDYGAFHRLALTWTWGEKTLKKPTAPVRPPSSVFKKTPTRVAPPTVPKPVKQAPIVSPAKPDSPKPAPVKPAAPEKPKRPRIGEGGYRLGG